MTHDSTTRHAARSFATVAVAIAVALAASVGALAAGPKPLPRPELLPLDASSIQQIQIIGKAVVDARASKEQDPKALALRQALLDVKTELDGRSANTGTVRYSNGCREGECSADSTAAIDTKASSGTSVTKFPALEAKREILRNAIAATQDSPQLAHMARKAQEIDAKVAALDTLPSEERNRSLKELRRQLTPSATPQDQLRQVPKVIVTFHTSTTHRPVVHANVSTVSKTGKKL